MLTLVNETANDNTATAGAIQILGDAIIAGNLQSGNVINVNVGAFIDIKRVTLWRSQ